jgi:AbrB family looped-hinge helix DNA binding protein
MCHTIVNAKGQVTIPAELRERLGIKSRTRIKWIEEKGRAGANSDDRATDKRNQRISQAQARRAVGV